MSITNDSDYIEKAKEILESAKKRVIRSINHVMVFAYYELGRLIVEEEQKGEIRAQYSKQTIKQLSSQLTEVYGRGYSARNLEQMRKFYLVYSKSQTLSAELQNTDFQLSWSHYLILIRMSNDNERTFYELESKSNRWSVRELKRQFDSALYERLALSSDKKSVKELGKKGQILSDPQDVIKEPYILNSKLFSPVRRNLSSF
ncbi:MAG: DUF1016 N-terminal domain-containing protein [Bacteroidota bacterium]